MGRQIGTRTFIYNSYRSLDKCARACTVAVSKGGNRESLEQFPFVGMGA